MQQLGVHAAVRSAFCRGSPLLVGGCRERAERDDRRDVVVAYQPGQPAVPVRGYRLVADVRVTAAPAVDAVQERVDHDVAASQAHAREQALGALPGNTDEDASGDGLRHCGILPEDDQPGAAVTASAVK